MTDEEKVYRYKFLFRYEDGKVVEKEVVWLRDAEEAFDRACALLDLSDCRAVRMFEYNEQYDEWYERVDLY